MNEKTQPVSTEREELLPKVHFFVVPDGLHPDTESLVGRFAYALALKLRYAERKYGYSDGWLRDDWMDECRAKLVEHVAKGDPRDVAAYAAFLWHHGERTTLSASNGEGGDPKYPSYDALLIIAHSVCGALARAGVDDCDDPGEAIDVMRERFERRLANPPSASVDVEQFRRPVESWKRKRTRSLENAIREGKKPDLIDGLRRNVADADRLLSLIDSAGGAKGEPAAMLPTPRNRSEAAAMAKIALAYLGVVEAHIDAAISRCETNATGAAK